jgi:hypothetical protein
MNSCCNRVVYPEKLTHDLFKKPDQYQLTGKDAWVYFKQAPML